MLIPSKNPIPAPGRGVPGSSGPKLWPPNLGFSQPWALRDLGDEVINEVIILRNQPTVLSEFSEFSSFNISNLGKSTGMPSFA